MELSDSKIKKFPVFPEISAQAQKIKKNPPRENFLLFLKRKYFVYFEKWSFLLFEEMKTRKKFYIFRKRNVLIFWERYVQNPSIFRTRSIFRTLVYSEHEAYSEHRQTFCKNDPSSKNKKNTHREKISYIFPKKFYLHPEVVAGKAVK